jgi:hypothetical protein
MGKNINIFPALPLFHYAAKRGYNWWYDDFHRNRTIASYMYGGEEFALKYIRRNMEGSQLIKERIYYDVIHKCQSHRDHVMKKQKITIEEWVRKWT